MIPELGGAYLPKKVHTTLMVTHILKHLIVSILLTDWIASGNAISRATGKPYSLLNQMILGRGGEYITFKQCQQEGGEVRKGEKAQMVVFWKFIEQEDEETHEKKQVPFLRYYSVFHIDQCEVGRS